MSERIDKIIGFLVIWYVAQHNWHLLQLIARLNFPAEKATFRIQDNPLIHALDDKLQTAQTSTVKLLFDYLKSEEYRE